MSEAIVEFRVHLSWSDESDTAESLGEQLKDHLMDLGDSNCGDPYFPAITEVTYEVKL